MKDDLRYIPRLIHKRLHNVWEGDRRNMFPVHDVPALVIVIPNIYDDVVDPRLRIALNQLDELLRWMPQVRL